MPADIITALLNAAKKHHPRIVLPEGQDERILTAATRLQSDAIARVTLLGDAQDIRRRAAAAKLDLTGIALIEPDNSELLEDYAQLYAQGPRNTNVGVARRLLRKPLFYAAMMLQAGHADAMLAGACHPTARVIEAGMMALGLARGIGTPSSYFLMILPDSTAARGRQIVFADCAVNVEPNAQQLADIAIASAHSAETLLRQPARVALLSFSTHGSAKHPRVDKVCEALSIARQRAPELLIDGELQADSALIASVADKKIKTPSAVAGQANVLIFPDLDSGNIAYKLTQYLANARAIGPFLQGFAKPICDLSRGATVDDIVAAAAVVLAQK